MIAALFLVPSLWQSPAPQSGRTLEGAERILRKLNAPLGKDSSVDPFGKVFGEAKSLAENLYKLPAKDSAEAWVRLMLDWEKASEKDPGYGQDAQKQWSSVMMPVLPEPAAWPLIREKLTKLPKSEAHEQTIALMDDLLGNDAEVLRYFERRRKQAESDRGSVGSLDFEFEKTALQIALRMGDLDYASKLYLKQADSMSFSNEGLDLVAVFGRERAETMLCELVLKSREPLYALPGDETQDIARAIVSANLKSLQQPQVGLTRGLSDFPFIEAQVGRFGADTFKSDSNSSAAYVYGLGLAQRGEMEKAEKIFAPLPEPYNTPIIGSLKEESEYKSTFELAAKLLDRKPLKSLWSLYEELGRLLGREDEVTKRLDAWLATPELDSPTRARYLQWKADIDARFGRSQEALSELEEAFKISPATAADPLFAIADATRNRHELDVVANGAANLGTPGSRIDVYGAYLNQDRLADAQMAAIKSATDIHDVNLSARGQGRLLNANPGAGTQLAQVYYNAGQAQEIVTLLHEYPSWGAVDLKEIVGYPESGRRSGAELGCFAAWAFWNTGQKDLAVRTLHDVVAGDPGSESAFKMLNEFEGAGAMSVYDEILKSAPLNSAALIWKGDLLSRLGRQEEAEQSIRKAVSLDPQDVGRYRGRRQEAYAVLAHVFAAAGKTAEAKLCEGVFEGAQLEQRGEELEMASLWTDALAQYDLALARNPSDSVAQMHRATLLRLLGKKDEAVAAYMKAVELLPAAEGTQRGLDLLTPWLLFNEVGPASIRTKLESLASANPKSHGPIMALAQLDECVGDKASAIARYQAVLMLLPENNRALTRLAIFSGNDPKQKPLAKESLLRLIRQGAPLQAYEFENAFFIFSNKAELWRAFRLAVSPKPPVMLHPLFPLEASKKSLSTGTRPLNTFNFQAPETPGAALAGLKEIQSLLPR